MDNENVPRGNRGPAVGMRVVRVPVSRRNFLVGSGAALVASLGASEVLAQSARAALTADFAQLGPDTAATLLQVARDVFPHDKLSDKYYAAAIRPYEAQA
ncbi:twin-arginine translocation signal domain-containing protein, partial [Bordetella hinzii]|nr:twin-arginine translocation signal domain-containing protein [Bordetella hinzii]